MTRYDEELAQLGNTYERALAADIGGIRAAISGASGFSVLGVGSGGSYTVASLLCDLHESYTGLVSRPSTPLELICNPSLASASPVFMISAEGKNPDIVEAFRRARAHSARPIHIITNRADGPLAVEAARLAGASVHGFDLPEKDGYLATNSLLFDAAIVARAYGQLDRESETMPSALGGLRLDSQEIGAWIDGARPFAGEAVRRGGVIVTFSPALRALAVDLESRLAEAALLHCQTADVRSLAHGRHLWFATRPDACAVVALLERQHAALWERTREHIPRAVPTLTMGLAGSSPTNLLAGLVALMRFVALVAGGRGLDPGRPPVPDFGRRIHYMDVASLVPPPAEPPDQAQRSKFRVLGARWPLAGGRTAVGRSLSEFRSSLERQEFRAVVLDYDGTLSAPQPTEGGPHEGLMLRLSELARAGIVVGIASGRGGSIRERLQAAFPREAWPMVKVGLYSAGYIGDLASPIPDPNATSEFLSHVTRILRRLMAAGAPIETIHASHPFQVSVRLRDGVDTDSIWFVVVDALRQAGLGASNVVKSAHSVDVLGAAANKSRLVAHLIKQHQLDPYSVLTVGDQGAWPGNDSSLLEHRYSLSVDVPSRRLDRGWKLAPASKRHAEATAWYLDRVRVTEPGRFRIMLPSDAGAQQAL